MATQHDWSELFPDVLQLVFERLSFTDFLRIKAVCSAWRSVSSRCIPKQDPFPWLILFSREVANRRSSCLLFNFGERKIYRTRDARTSFSKIGRLASYGDYLASSGSWFLFLDWWANLHILNLLTLEKIRLPPIESLKGQLNIERTYQRVFLLRRHGERHSYASISAYSIKAVLWIDETTKDYLVVWTLERRHCLAFCRKGDNGWREIATPKSHWDIFGCTDMAYKNKKLYVYSCRNFIKIFDFSRDFPRETTRPLYFYCGLLGHKKITWETYIAVTTSGELLMVVKTMTIEDHKTRFFYVYKINANGTTRRVNSLGDEALILDQRITVPAKEIRGIKANSIYFKEDSRYNLWRTSSDNQGDIGNFNLTTQTIERFKRSKSLCRRFKNAMWFFPGRGDK